MYWILFVMGTVAAVVIALITGGLASPRAHAVTSAAEVPAPIDQVWQTVRNVGAYPSWRSDVIESVVSTGDDGAEWTERSRRRSIRFGVTLDQPPHRFGARILDDDLPFTGEWEWQLESVPGGTRVSLTERGEIGNPIMRFVAEQMRGHSAGIDAYLAALVAQSRGQSRS